jgi:hypothetical protein
VIGNQFENKYEAICVKEKNKYIYKKAEGKKIHQATGVEQGLEGNIFVFMGE